MTVEQRPLPLNAGGSDPAGQTAPSGAGPTGQATLEDLVAMARDCRRCGLRDGAENVVFGEGSPLADIVIIGEGPGAEEDRLGRPFVGRAGQLLDRIIDAADLKRSDVYITNVVKCRPPGNRNPSADESRTCLDWLKKQIEAIDPLLILLLGRVPAQVFLGSGVAISAVRGVWHWWEGYMVLPTYHPAALLRDPSRKRPTWEDIKTLMAAHRELTGRTRA